MSTQNETAKTVLRFSILALLALLLFTPLIVGSTMYFPFIVGKGLLIRTLVQIAAALYIILAVIDPASRPRKSPLMWALGIFTVVATLATIFSQSPFRSFWSNFERMEGLVLMLHLAALFVIASACIRKREWAWFGWISLGISIIVGAYALGDIGKAVAQAKLAGITDLENTRRNVRISGSLGNSSYLGVYALMHVFIASLAALMIYRGNREAELLTPGATHKPGRRLTSGQWIGLLAVVALVVFNLFILYKTGTRGSFVGLVGGLFVMSAYLAWKERNKVLKYGALGVAVALILCISLLGIFKNSDWVQSKPQLARYAALVSLDVKQVINRLGEDRTMIWNMAIQGAEDKPWLGWGQDNFGYVFAKYYDPGMYAREQWFDRSHNVFLDWLIAAGFLGLLSYLSLFVLAAYILLSKRARMTVVERAVILGALVAYFIHNLFVFDNLTSYVLFFLILAYLHDRYAHDHVPAPAKNGVDYGTLILGTSFAVAVVFVFTLYQSVYQPMQQNFALAHAVSIANEQSKVTAENVTKLKVQPLDMSYDDFVKIYKMGRPTSEVFEQLSNVTPLALTSPLFPDASKQKFYNLYNQQVMYHAEHDLGDARYPYFLAAFYKRIGMKEEALRYAKMAYDLSPQKQTFAYAVAQILVEQGKFVEAMPYLQHAYENKPENLEAFAYYVSILAETSKNPNKTFDTLKLGGLAEVLAQGYNKYGHKLLVDPRLWAIFKENKQPAAAKLFAARLSQLVPEKKAELEGLTK